MPFLAVAICFNAVAEDQLKNGGFESGAKVPEGWQSFSSDGGSSVHLDSEAKTGSKSLRLEARGEGAQFLGYYQDIDLTATNDKEWECSAFFKTPGESAGAGGGKASIHFEWTTPEKLQQLREDPRHIMNAIRVDKSDPYLADDPAWSQRVVQGTRPDEATILRVVVVFRPSAEQRAVLVDDVELRSK